MNGEDRGKELDHSDLGGTPFPEGHGRLRDVVCPIENLPCEVVDVDPTDPVSGVGVGVVVRIGGVAVRPQGAVKS